ncbi:hypothetical protein [Streptomyces gobitricini]|uniref:AI-2E family transporter n=1 Tax=Streptomyces gobitricini TaxID=68211 RepID=A0ABN3LXR3_9ACTN
MNRSCCGALAAVIVVWVLLGLFVSEQVFFLPLVAVALVRILIEGKHG